MIRNQDDKISSILKNRFNIQRNDTVQKHDKLKNE